MSKWVLVAVLSCAVAGAAAQPAWQPDTNGDHVIDLADFLDFLYIYGAEDTDMDGFYGAFDLCPEEAGTLNGCPEPPSCVPVAFDAYTYAVGQIGDQCWFLENLRTTAFASGDPIPEETGSATGWIALNDTAARCQYLWDDANGAAYGYLYNGRAVLDPRGLCPTGWHVPSDLEWMALEAHIGMTEAELGTTGFRGTSAAALKDSTGWNGDNATGFAALPGGWRRNSGSWLVLGLSGVFWTSSAVGSSEAWFRSMHSNNAGINRASIALGDGMSIRCLLD